MRLKVCLPLLLLAPLIPLHAQEPLASAHWITAPQTTPLPLFRRAFDLPSRPIKATLLISGLGQYEAHLNGKNVTTDVLTPGWTDYRKRIFYNTYDVLPLLTPGPNAIGVMLGNSMYNVPATPGRYTKFTATFGDPKLIAKLEVSFRDGKQIVITTDTTWQTHPGPITFTSAYGGEDFDARLEPEGWDTAKSAAADWTQALETTGPGGKLVAELAPPIRVDQTFAGRLKSTPKPGVTVWDLGQNFAGWPLLAATGPAGTTLKLTAGELLDAQGNVTQRSDNVFPKAPNLYTFTLKGTGSPETWHPRFSYWGFRYIQVEASNDHATLNEVAGQFLHASVLPSGHFSAQIEPAIIPGQAPSLVSTPHLFNDIHALIDRAILSNMVSVLTDCPTREKLGWLEQTHLAAGSIMANYDVSALYRKTADDIEDDQFPPSSGLRAGLVPTVAPEFAHFADPNSPRPPNDFGDTPEWGSAVILSPWAAYQHYGDPAPLRAHYGSMQRYLDYLRRRRSQNPDGLVAYGLGDWYDIGPGEPGRSKLTTLGVTGTAVYFQDLQAMQHTATLLGLPQDAAAYAKEAAEVRNAFNAKFFHPETNLYDRGSQSALGIPLALGIVPDDRRPAVLANLVADIEAHAWHTTSGEIGFHYVVRALTDNARSDVLYKMLSVTTSPSYAYQLTKGATALTEAWDINPRSSQNHFMLGHAEEWFYRGLAGIDLDMSRAPGQQITITPYVPDSPGDTASVLASQQTPLGEVSSTWTRTRDRLHVEIKVPAGAHALFTMPSPFSQGVLAAGKPVTLGPGLHRFDGRR